METDYGFHIIKVTDKIPALGDFTVAHLFLGISKNATSADSAEFRAKIDSIYQLLQGGAKFEDLVKQFSDDKGSAAKGGVLPKRGVNRLMPEFIASISKLQNAGDYSVPIYPGLWLAYRKTCGTQTCRYIRQGKPTSNKK